MSFRCDECPKEFDTELERKFHRLLWHKKQKSVVEEESQRHSSAWIKQIFRAREAKSGGIVRRQVNYVWGYASEEELIREVKERGFHIVRNENQYIIFCNRGNFTLIC